MISAAQKEQLSSHKLTICGAQLCHFRLALPAASPEPFGSPCLRRI
jgi:hypothetical protein